MAPPTLVGGGAGEVRRTSGERALPSSTSVPFFSGVRYCGHGAEARVKFGGCGSREMQGVAGRRAKRSARCTQEEKSGHLSIESVGAEEEHKCAQQSA
eukprot:scaffold143773_cov133-Phaeocystis_antarctica.AAC.2